ncbi:MAG TPA: copper resistance protein CopC [Aggregatilineaceae bacterium]|nr:copper resistance protein CopC [Aggregatilineaceae bacterium]
MRRWWGIGILAVLLCLGTFRAAGAHATLVRSDPPANSELAASPAAIRLWFSEGVEPKFSAFTLLDARGQTVNTPASQVDPTDSTQLFMQPPALPNGLYTVVWHTVSAEDGHSVMGSFAFSVGVSLGTASSPTFSADAIPPDSAVVRWLNLLSLSLAVGSIGFVLFVWSPAIQGSYPAIERRMNGLIWTGWALLGLTGVLMLLLQVSLAAQTSILAAPGSPALLQVVSATRYGSLWLARMALWLILGLEIFLGMARKKRSFYWLALLFGGAILLTNSLFSHASAAPDAAAPVLSDWLHLSMTALWIGGLVQFVNVFAAVRRRVKPDLPALDSLVGYFSNFARVLVVGLLLTGLYAAWLEVGSLQGLFTTLYGQVLLVKGFLVLLLIGVAGINLVFTHRGLKAGQTIWAGRLRRLITAEILLAVGVLAAVGALTSLSPSRTVLAQRALAAAAAPAKPILATQVDQGLHVQLLITPGWVGPNTFTITLTDDQGKSVTDASLIRLRFDDRTTNLGESELHIQPAPGAASTGAYTVSGANLSQAGSWQLRVSIQRPAHYDTVVDFQPAVSAPPVQTTPASLPNDIPVLLVAGALALGVGGFFVNRNPFPSGGRLVAGGLVLLGGVFLISGVGALGAGRVSQTGETAPQANIQIGLETPLDQAAVGKTTLVITLRDADNKPIRDARISVQGDMTHAGMAPAFGTADNGPDGRYAVPFEWTMGGDWIVTVKATLPNGQAAQKTFNLTVKEP